MKPIYVSVPLKGHRHVSQNRDPPHGCPWASSWLVFQGDTTRISRVHRATRKSENPLDPEHGRNVFFPSPFQWETSQRRALEVWHGQGAHFRSRGWPKKGAIQTSKSSSFSKKLRKSFLIITTTRSSPKK